MSGMFSGNASFLRETILSWAPREKLRIQNKQANHRAKPFKRHLKKDGSRKKHCNECLIRFEIHKKARDFFGKQFVFGLFGAN